MKTTNGGLVFVTTNNTSVPGQFLLSQNYPNPFNSFTVIEYEVREPSIINLKLHNIEGQEMQTVTKGYRSLGIYEVLLDASDLSTGVYFYSLYSNRELIETKKLTILK